MGDLSPHFSVAEFRCHHCGEVRVSPALLERLERLRSAIRQPIVIVSGYRCAQHNARVGGAPRSLHLSGGAADIRTGVARIHEARRAGFTGIGYRGSWAVHVDVRQGAVVEFPD